MLAGLNLLVLKVRDRVGVERLGDVICNASSAREALLSSKLDCLQALFNLNLALSLQTLCRLAGMESRWEAVSRNKVSEC